MDGIRVRTRAEAATVVAVALGYLAVALDQGGYATTSVAWGAAVLWGVVALGIVLGAWPEVSPPRLAILAGACFLGLAALSVISLAWADDGGRAFSAALLPAAYAGLLALIVLVSPAVRPRALLIGIAVGAVLITLLALMSRLFPGFLGLSDTASVATVPGAKSRLSYPIGYWNSLAACVAVGFVLLTWLGSSSARRLARATAIGLLPFLGLAIFFTSSRGGAAAAVVGVAILVGLGPARERLAAGALLGAAGIAVVVLIARGRYDLVHDLGTSTQDRQGLEIGGITLLVAIVVGWARWLLDDWLATAAMPRRARPYVLGVAIAAVIAGIVAINPATWLSRFGDIPTAQNAAPGQRSFLSSGGSGRAQFWEAALDAYGSQPFGGVGAGNYELYWNAHPEAPIVTGNAHSLFLEELADLGPLGLVLALGPFALAIIGAAQRWRGRRPELVAALALLGTASVGTAIDWTWKLPSSFIPAVLAIALLTGRATIHDREARAPQGGRFSLGVATVLCAWAVIWVAALVILSAWRLDSSREATARGDLASAADDARSAASIEPFSPEPRLQLALIEQRAGDLHQARDAALDAIDKARGDWRGWALLARIDAQRGHRVAAKFEAAEAQALAPIPLPSRFTGGSL